MIGECLYIQEGKPYVSPSGRNDRTAIFECPLCGNLFNARICDVKAKKTVSCGCYRSDSLKIAATTHGLRDNKLYGTWLNMKARCYNSRRQDYVLYGGRGIGICESWRDDFKNFHDYVTKLPHFGENGRTLDRIDNDGNYEPGNVRWATGHTQSTNRRLIKLSSSGYRGVYRTRNGTWMCSLTCNGERIYLGTFDNKKDAVVARNQYINVNKLVEYELQEWKGD